MRKVVSGWPVAIAATLAAAFSYIVLLEYFRAPAGRRAVDEGALIENMTAFLWFAGGLVLVTAALRLRPRRRDFLLFAYLLIMLGLREVGLHSSLPPWDVAHLPAGERFRFGFSVLIGLAVLALYVPAVIRWLRSVRDGWSVGRRWAVGLAWCAGLLLAAHAFDSVAGAKVWHFSPHDKWLIVAAEETLELAAAVVAMLIVLPLPFHEESMPRAVAATSER
ncbi:MAG TPA: hypothetical protein VFT12_02330 [Thermoanaerobaculia bacterium]|nr:hypothetical protein [Thermoanaerobaculia bacterium]